MLENSEVKLWGKKSGGPAQLRQIWKVQHNVKRWRYRNMIKNDSLFDGIGDHRANAWMPPFRFPGGSREKTMIYEAAWPYYSTVAELIDKADGVFEGRIVGIYFEVINYQSGKIAQSADEEYLALHTVYEIETSRILKGEDGERKYIKVMGAIPEYEEDAQETALKKLGLWEDGMGISIMAESEPLEVDAEYLFVTSNSAGDYLNVINIDQYAFIAEADGEASDDGRPTYAGIKAYFGE